MNESTMISILLRLFMLTFLAFITLHNPTTALASDPISIITESGEKKELLRETSGVWKSKVWVLYGHQHHGSLSSSLKSAIKQKDFVSRIHNVELEIFQQFEGDGDQLLVAVGPFENKSDAKQYFEDYNASTTNKIDFSKGFVDTQKTYAHLQENKSSEFLQASKGQTHSAELDLTKSQQSDQGSSRLDYRKLSVDDKKAIQTALAELDFYFEPIDGALGKNSKNAIYNYKLYHLNLEDDEAEKDLTIGQYRTLISENTQTEVNPQNASKPVEKPLIDESLPPPPVKQSQSQEALQMKIANLETDNARYAATNSKYKTATAAYDQKITDLNEQIDYFSNTPIIKLLEAQVLKYTYFVDLKQENDPEPINSSYVEVNPSCSSVDNKKSISENTQILIKDDLCVIVNHPEFERTPEKNPEIDLIGKTVIFDVQGRFPTQVSDIKVVSVNTEMDFNSCGFNLEFTNRESGKSFEVTMYNEDENGTFVAQNKSIVDALDSKRLEPEENNWSQLDVRIQSINDPAVTCEVMDNRTYQIQKEPSDEAFKIKEDGELFFGKLLLGSRKDDLEIFISANIGAPIEISGTNILDSKFPFSEDLRLQNSYFEGFLGALEQYMNKPSEFKKVKIYVADEKSYSVMFESSLPTSVLEISSEQLGERRNSHKMPSVSSILSESKIPTSSGVIVAGSFGLDTDRSCAAQEFTKILSNRKDSPVLIINFASGDTSNAGYKRISDYPLTFQCSNRSQVLLLHPSEVGLQSPSKIKQGFLKLISERLSQ